MLARQSGPGLPLPQATPQSWGLIPGPPGSWLGTVPSTCGESVTAVPMDLYLQNRGTLASWAVPSGGFSECHSPLSLTPLTA